MTNYKLAYVEHIAQLLIKNLNHLVHQLVGHELELVRQDVREITKNCEEWLAEMKEKFDAIDD